MDILFYVSFLFYQEYKSNGSPAIVNGEPLSPNQQSLTKKGKYMGFFVPQSTADDLF